MWRLINHIRCRKLYHLVTVITVCVMCTLIYTSIVMLHDKNKTAARQLTSIQRIYMSNISDKTVTNATRKLLSGTHKPITDTHKPITGTHKHITGTRKPLTDTRKQLTGTYKPLTDTHKPLTGTSRSLQPQQPIEHVMYLKTHKTGSSTVNCILAEYCRVHRLRPLLPSKLHINQGDNFDKYQLLLDYGIGPYDMVYAHFIYRPEMYKYLHNDTFTFTTIREPFKQFMSAFDYYKYSEKIPYLGRIHGPYDREMFLASHSKYEVSGYASWTNNRQSMDLGYDLSHPFDDVDYIKQFIESIDEHFDLVLISEYFHESLILLKRKLRWKTQDILYFKKNSGPWRPPSAMRNTTLVPESTLRKQHASFSQADIALYNYFLEKFKKSMSLELGLNEEVSEYLSVQSKVESFCFDTEETRAELDIPPGQWTDSVSIDKVKCVWLQQGEFEQLRYHRYLRKGGNSRIDQIDYMKIIEQIEKVKIM